LAQFLETGRISLTVRSVLSDVGSPADARIHLLSGPNLKRPILSFTVEVRRRSRLAAPSSSPSHFAAAAPSQTALYQESHRIASAAFEPEKAVLPSAGTVSPHSNGRILPSLAPDERIDLAGREAPIRTTGSRPPSNAEKRRVGRSIKGKDTKSDAAIVSGRELGGGVPPLNGSIWSSEQTASRIVSADEPTTTASATNASGLAVRLKAKRQEKTTSRDERKTTPSTNGRRVAIKAESSATPVPSPDQRSSQIRKRKIMGRYVFRDEPRLGERWKRRLIAKADR
jgi:hypothetical protein